MRGEVYALACALSLIGMREEVEDKDDEDVGCLCSLSMFAPLSPYAPIRRLAQQMFGPVG